MKFSITQCSEMAHKVGGEVGECILELVAEIEDLRKQVAGIKYPALVGSSEVADLLGIDRRNLHHKRKTRGFPDPILETKSGPLWVEEVIRTYREESEDRRRKDEG